MNPRPEFLEIAEQCGARITGKPDGSEPIEIVFSIDAWRKFDAATEDDAQRYQWLASGYTEAELDEAGKKGEQPPLRPQTEAINHLALWYLPKPEIDALVDRMRRQHG